MQKEKTEKIKLALGKDRVKSATYLLSNGRRNWETIAEKTGKSITQIRNATYALESEGLLQKIKQGVYHKEKSYRHVNIEFIKKDLKSPSKKIKKKKNNKIQRKKRPFRLKKLLENKGKWLHSFKEIDECLRSNDETCVIEVKASLDKNSEKKGAQLCGMFNQAFRSNYVIGIAENSTGFVYVGLEQHKMVKDELTKLLTSKNFQPNPKGFKIKKIENKDKIFLILQIPSKKKNKIFTWKEKVTLRIEGTTVYLEGDRLADQVILG